MTVAADRRRVAGVVEDALSAVFDPQLVAQLRADSPLDLLGMTPADAICVADAVAAATDQRCRLDDADFTVVVTVADLIDSVQRRLDGWQAS